MSKSLAINPGLLVQTKWDECACDLRLHMYDVDTLIDVILLTIVYTDGRERDVRCTSSYVEALVRRITGEKHGPSHV
jgi:hypothetical protein